ncbi:hypothetical protein FBZ94_102865 [Bradyrhizobium sacchari]|uniref:Uncharacterized protein n=1 Tax=Bradyrhizobium sacchari TaxID=1399419 RepID=A0A560J244_9BRAD|nr:hypothetical protein FBZ94_102865 [Bradyrhizobium sacchari]TWB81641.1 hypothetical protein FBZ95_102865 [Bradyrhizobium sacchari]
MRTTWTPHALPASSLAGEAVVSGSSGQGVFQDSFGIGPVTIDQFPAVILSAAMPPSAARLKGAYIVAWQRCFAPT